MKNLFQKLYLRVIKEAGEQPPMDDPAQQGGDMPPTDDAEAQVDTSLENPLGEADQEPVAPEELELAKLAIRALYFNADSKDLHDKKLRYKGKVIPFEMISDEFEKHKIVLPVLFFVEKLMDYYEGKASKWTERPEVKGKSIVDKIRAFDAVASPEEKLDNGKRVYWTRIILNCLLYGTPSENLVTSDVNEDTVGEIFNLLKQQYGGDTRGMVSPSVKISAPGNI